MGLWNAVSDYDYDAEGLRVQEPSQVERVKCQDCGRWFQFWPTPNVLNPVTCRACTAHQIEQDEQKVDAALEALLVERSGR